VLTGFAKRHVVWYRGFACPLSWADNHRRKERVLTPLVIEIEQGKPDVFPFNG